MNAAGDWRLFSKIGRECEIEHGRQADLAASLTALRSGVEYLPGGEPRLPNALRNLLTDTCATCGHSTLAWAGSLAALNEQIAAAEKRIAESAWLLDVDVKSAEALLAEAEVKV